MFRRISLMILTLFLTLPLKTQAEENILEKLLPHMDKTLPYELQIEVLKNFLPEIRGEIKRYIEKTVLKGHESLVNSLCYSPDGKVLASGSKDKAIKLWDVKTGTCIKTLKDNSEVCSVCYSPDGEVLASGSFDKTITLWDIKTGKRAKTLHGHWRAVRSVCYSPDGKTLASGSLDREIKLWNVKNGRCIGTLNGHQDSVESVCYSPDGKMLASGSKDTTIKLWDVQSGACIKTQRHDNWVNSVCYNSNGNMLASGSRDKTLKLWDVQSGACITTLQEPFWVHSVCFSPDGKRLASGLNVNTIKVWDVQSGACINTYHPHQDWVRSVCFSPDGKMVASGSFDKSIILRNLHPKNTLNCLTDNKLTATQILLLYILSKNTCKELDLNAVNEALNTEYNGKIPEVMDLKKGFLAFDSNLRDVITGAFGVNIKLDTSK